MASVFPCPPASCLRRPLRAAPPRRVLGVFALATPRMAREGFLLNLLAAAVISSVCYPVIVS